MRESCLKMQQAIEASEGPNADPGSSDVSTVTYCSLHLEIQVYVLYIAPLVAILQLKEEVNHALKVSSNSLLITKLQLHACLFITTPRYNYANLQLCDEGEARCSESTSALGSKATAALVRSN